MLVRKCRLILGTVQLGRNYGLDAVQQPTKEESHAILDAALAGGIDTFDTAGDYGEAVDILGEWMQSRGVAGRTKIISKLAPRILGEQIGEVDAAALIRADIEQTLRRLHLDRVNYYLLNNSRYVFRPDALEALRKVKSDSLVERIGVSTYDEDEALEALQQKLDCVEVPYNALDQRLSVTSFWTKSGDQDATVFARSPFLQGLLLMDPEHLPLHLSHAKTSLIQFSNIARDFGISQMQAALLFALEACPADGIVFGVKTLQQLNEILEAARTKAPDGFVEAVEKQFKNVDRAIVNPMLWSKERQGRKS